MVLDSVFRNECVSRLLCKGTLRGSLLAVFKELLIVQQNRVAVSELVLQTERLSPGTRWL